MAKEAVSPVEKHLEKGVLALTVLLFLGVVAGYLISSPNTLTIDRNAVGPARIYEVVEDEAIQLRTRIRGAQPPDERPRDHRRPPDSLAVSLLPPPVPYGPRVPRLEVKEAAEVELVSVVPLSKPVVVLGRSGAVLTPSLPITALPERADDYYARWNEITAEDRSYVMPVNWVTAAATLDVEAQFQRAREAGYPPGRAVPYVVGAELERRERFWDGTYADWKPVKTYAPLTLPEELPFLEVTEIDGKPMVPDEQHGRILRFARDVQDVDHRLELMRPMPPRVAYGKYWLREPLERLLGVDLLRLDDEILFGPEEGNCPYWDRYPKEPRPADYQPPDLTKPEVKLRVTEEAISEVQAWLDMGCYEAAIARIENLILTTGPGVFTDEQLERLERMLDEAKRRQQQKVDEAKQREARGEPPLPRELSAVQAVWVHDTLPESVVSGKAYQYRMRALLYNNYAGAAAELKNPADAEIVLLVGEWSPPSDDVAIPYDSEFYLVGRKRDEQAKVDVFKWHEGQWAKESFMVNDGDPIGGKEFVRLGDRTAAPVPVDFSTGAIVVRLDFNYPYRRRRERRGVITLDAPKPTASMVYLDSAGELHRRILDQDKQSPRYEEMKAAASREAGPGPGTP